MRETTFGTYPCVRATDDEVALIATRARQVNAQRRSEKMQSRKRSDSMSDEELNRLWLLSEYLLHKVFGLPYNFDAVTSGPDSGFDIRFPFGGTGQVRLIKQTGLYFILETSKGEVGMSCDYGILTRQVADPNAIQLVGWIDRAAARDPEKVEKNVMLGRHLKRAVLHEKHFRPLGELVRKVPALKRGDTCWGRIVDEVVDSRPNYVYFRDTEGRGWRFMYDWCQAWPME